LNEPPHYSFSPTASALNDQALDGSKFLNLPNLEILISDDVIMRTIIDLPQSQVTALDSLCQEKGISRAEAVRRAVDAMLSSQQISSQQASFGAWTKPKNSRALVDDLREEWGR